MQYIAIFALIYLLCKKLFSKVSHKSSSFGIVCLLVGIFTLVFCKITVPHHWGMYFVALFAIFIFNYRLMVSSKAGGNPDKVIGVMAKLSIILSSFVSILVTSVLLYTLVSNSVSFFGQVNFFSFITGAEWFPHMYELSPERAFGVLPVLLGSFMIGLIALFIALIIGLPSAIYLVYYTKPSVAVKIRPFLESLVSMPTIVYGYLATFTFAPFLIKFCEFINFELSPESAIVPGSIIGIMIAPYIITLSVDCLKSVPKDVTNSAIAMGSTTFEVVSRVSIPYALSGIIASSSLAFSRALGETMIVVMSAGLVANMSFNPLEPMTTVTVQVVNLITGDHAFDSPQRLLAFALGLVLFVTTLFVNFGCRKYANWWNKKIGI